MCTTWRCQKSDVWRRRHRNNNTIQGDASDLTVALNRAAVELMFVSTYGWVLTER